MKKILSVCAALSAFLLITGNAFAAPQTFTSANTTVLGGANFKISTGVTLIAETNTGNTAFRVASKHLSGDKTYKATSVAPSVAESNGPAVGTAITSSDLPSMP